MLVGVPFEELKRGVDDFFDIRAIGRFAVHEPRPARQRREQRNSAEPGGGMRRAGLTSELGP